MLVSSYVRLSTWLRSAAVRLATFRSERGQTTAEYALVILAAAAVAVVLIAWARSSGKLPGLFDTVVDDVVSDAQ